MKNRLVFESINLSVVPYRSEYLCLLAGQYKKSGADGLAVICSDRFPWDNPSWIPAREFYDEREIQALIEYCRKNDFPCVPVFLQSDLASILFSLKGYEQYSRMNAQDLRPFYYKLLPEFIGDILGLFHDSSVMFLCVDNEFDLDRLDEFDNVGFVRFQRSEKDKDKSVICQSSDGKYVIKHGGGLQARRPDCSLFPQLPEGELFSKTCGPEAQYRGLVAELNSLADSILVADIHSRTGSAYPLHFWRERLALTEGYASRIAAMIEENHRKFQPCISECWLERRMYCERVSLDGKINNLKEICRQHIYFFETKE
ncbi:MAG: hypothetical protein JW874_01105 [Spirochaetales bacterium]|nr:hypothetical protein [Spirochaetales bacterium]